jgi:hypothetical protein
MNAISHGSQRYNRIQTPENLMPLRTGHVRNIEYLDAHRAKKLRLLAQQRAQEAELSRIRELEDYYNMKRYHASADSGRRKLNAAYEIKPMQAYFDDGPPKRAEPQPRPRPAAEKERAQAQARPVLRGRGVVSTILSIMLAFMMLAGVLVKQAEISNQTYQNAQAEKRIAALQEELSKLDMDSALREDLTSVQYSAAARGMAQPADNQIVFVESEPELPDTYELAAAAPQNTITDLSGNTDIRVSGAVVNTGAEDKAGLIDRIGQFFKDAGAAIQGWIN